MAALLAVCLQIFVLQTHVDGLGGLGAGAAVADGAGHVAKAEAKNSAPDKATACAICEANARSGAALLFAGPVLATTSGVIANEARIPLRRGPVVPAHAWQSRAPPVSL